MMRSWPGILALSSDRAALRSLVQLLSLPTTVKGASRSKVISAAYVPLVVVYVWALSCCLCYVLAPLFRSLI